jgi:outer membrane protein OmpA-like peptidoglycan-associated protein/tetratricopeptide (TPR) repeat protein
MLLRSIILSLTLLTLTLVCIAQSPSKLLKQANSEYESLSYKNAIQGYEVALKKNEKSFTDDELRFLRIRLAWCYRQIKDSQNAERVYRDLFNNSPKFVDGEIKNYLYFAQILSSNGKHEEAKLIYQKYNELQELDKRGEGFNKLYSNLDVLNRNSGSYRLEYLGINTSNADFSPTFYKKGLVFVSGRGLGEGIKRVFEWDASPFLDLYYLEDLKAIKSEVSSAISSSAKTTQKTTALTKKLGEDFYTPPTANDSRTIGNSFLAGNNGYEEKANIPSQKFSRNLNSKYHEGPATFFHDGSKIVFTRNNYYQGEEKKSKEGITKLKLFIADLVNNEWQRIREFPYNNDEYSTGHPTLTIDDKIMYFVSNMPGGFGGTDIYMSRYDNGKWSKPMNLGSQINTTGNEMFPFVDERGNLYFSSDGIPGLGDLDMFFIPMNTATGMVAGKPRNLGAPLNSNRDDFGIITDSERKEGFFSSNRKRGGSDDDIYWFSRMGALYGCRDVVVSVTDKDTKQPFDRIRLEYFSKTDQNDKKSAITDNKGILKVCLEADYDFTFSATQNGYLPTTIDFSNRDASDYEPSKLEILLKRKPIEEILKTKPKESDKLAKLNANIATNNNPISTIFRGVVTAGNDSTAIAGVQVKFINQCDGSVQEMTTGADGSYEFKRDINCDYVLEAFKDNFGKSTEFLLKITKKRKLSAKKVAKISNSLFDTKLYRVGDVVKLDNIYYEYDSYKLRKDAVRELQKLVGTMKKYPNMIIEILSHTDSRGNAQMNLQLSQQRADFVVDFLAKNGIARERTKAIGKGETEPVNACGDGVQCTEPEYQRNRRTEFKILQIEKI